MPGKPNGTRIVLGLVATTVVAIAAGLTGWFASNTQAIDVHEKRFGHTGALERLSALRDSVTDIKDDQDYMQGQINQLITNTALIIQKLEDTE